MVEEIGRRQLLAGAGGAAAIAALGRPAPAGAGSDAFPHGVASFDPTPTSVLLWTRLATAGEVTWRLAADEALEEIVAEGTAQADEAQDGTVVVDVTDLEPGRSWWYRFEADGARSPLGRTRTAPGRPGARLRVGLVSCARFATTGFAAYRDLAGRELDLVVHVGDYVYEDGDGGARPHDPPHRCTTLEDYRTRYGQHRLDPDLQALHARHPMVAVWDDHEVAGNAWRDGARDHDEATDGPWLDRLLAAGRARAEWLPGRTATGADGRLQAWRTLRLGPADLVVLDTRTWGRDRPPTAWDDLDAPRELLGEDQHRFAVAALRAEDRAPWVLLANQVLLHPLALPTTPAVAEALEGSGYAVFDGRAINPDQWDGYPWARERLLVQGVGGGGGVIALTGDLHSSWAWEGPANDGGEPVMVEVVAPSVTSTPFGDLLPVAPGLVEVGVAALDQDLSFVELTSHGYVVLDLTPDRAQADWWFVDPDGTATATLGAARSVPRQPPMRFTAVDLPSEEPPPPTAPTTEPSRPRPADDKDDDSGLPLVPAAAVGAVAAAGAGLVALRRRRG